MIDSQHISYLAREQSIHSRNLIDWVPALFESVELNKFQFNYVGLLCLWKMEVSQVWNLCKLVLYFSITFAGANNLCGTSAGVELIEVWNFTGFTVSVWMLD